MLDIFASRQLQDQRLIERCDIIEVEAVEAFDGGEPTVCLKRRWTMTAFTIPSTSQY